MQRLQQNTTTLFAPDFESQGELYNFTERLIEGLPGRSGNALLLFKLGIPTASAGIVLPRALRQRLDVQLYLDAGPGKNFVRHGRPSEHNTDASLDSDEGGPLYRLRISRLPVPQKHQVRNRTAL